MTSSNGAESENPMWLNVDFLEKHLRHYYGRDEIKVYSLNVKSATGAGENFASSIYRVQVDFAMDFTDKKITKSIIVKAALSSGLAFKTLSAHNVYNKEIEFYGEIVPHIQRLLKKLHDPNELIAKTFGVCKLNKVMLFEDLATKGYGMASIQKGFNLVEAKEILRKSATFHAVCAVLQEEHPNIFANFKYGALSRDSDVFHNFYYAQFDVMLELLSTWPDFDRYTEKLRRIRNDVVERGLKIFDPDPNHFNTLNHGDFWLNNIMIKPKKGENTIPFENVMFIDFQDSCWASPTIDLHYFLNTSLCESLRPQSFNELIETYHEKLSTTLNRLEYREHIPTRSEFFEQFNARNFYGFIASCTVQPIMINESTEDADLEAMVATDERSMKYRRNMFKQPKSQAILRKLIPFYDQLGVFD